MPPDASAARSSISEALAGVLANPGIRRIEAAWAAGIVADWAYLVALLVVAYRAGGALSVGILGLVRMAPTIALGPFAAIPLRRLRGGRALVVVHAVRAGAAVATAVLLALDGPAVVAYLLAAGVAGAGSLVRPVQASFLPAFARTPDELIAANVASSTGEGIGTFVGPLVGGFVVAVAGPAPACGLAALIAIFTTGLLLGLESAEDAGGAHGERPGTFRLDPAAGVRALAARRGPALLIGDFLAQVYVRGLLTTLVVVMSISFLGLGEGGIGLLNGSIGAGGLAGAVVALVLTGRPRLAPAFAVALALWGLPIAVIALGPFPLLAVGALFVTGLSNAVLDVAGFTLLQRSVPQESRLAVLGLFEGLIGAGVALGGLTAPLLLGPLGTRGALVVTGAILPILALATWPRVSRVDGEVIVPARQLGLLRAIPMFAPLPMTALERLAGAAAHVTFAPGEVLMAEGEPGDRYIVIETGNVDVMSRGGLLRQCGPGTGIGEIALLRRVPRTATAIARSPVSAYSLDAAAFLDAVAAPASAAAAALVVRDRLARSREIASRRRPRVPRGR